MIRIIVYTVCIIICLGACRNDVQSLSDRQEVELSNGANIKSILDPTGKILSERFSPPEGYKRTCLEKESYSHYLRSLPLKPYNESVQYYDGNIKHNKQVYTAVVDLSIGDKDLHQCADAVIRLRAEYLWRSKDYDKIHFNFTNGFRVDYTQWVSGKKMVFNGNKTYWTEGPERSFNYEDFWEYMELIFMYAGTASLSQELKRIPIGNMQIGDIIIKGGHPGHAVVVVDMAMHKMTNERLYILAQSYMPAQELQILRNSNNENISPWYSLGNDKVIMTPEWTFTSDQLMRFREL